MQPARSEVSDRTPILVTGGAGYIGSHVCQALDGAGFMPVTMDSLVTGHRESVLWGPLEVGDIGDGSRVREVVDAYEPAAVVHLAAHAYVGESVKEPRKYYRNNVGGSLSLFEALLDRGHLPVVFSSTCATYGIPEKNPIDEGAPQLPINPYGATKLAVEHALTDFDHAYGLRSVVLRYFNAAGADPGGHIGERHDPEPHLIPLVLAAALGRRSGIDIFGTKMDTPDGTCVRDYVHVTDLADAHVRSLHWLLDGNPSLQLNLGTGNGVSVAEVIDTVEEVTQRSIERRNHEPRPGDPPVLVADATFARESLGWRPSRSTIRTIVEDAWSWHVRLETLQQSGPA